MVSPTQSTEYSSLCFMVGLCPPILCVIVCISSPQAPSPAPNLGNHKSVLYIYVSASAFSIGLCLKSKMCNILDCTYAWYHVIFVFLFLPYFT